MISTRGRYALRLMTDLAKQEPETYTPLKDIAKRQEISEKYGRDVVYGKTTIIFRKKRGICVYRCDDGRGVL